MERQITFTKEYQDLGVASPVWESVDECVRNAVGALPMRDIQVASEVSDPKFLRIRCLSGFFTT